MSPSDTPRAALSRRAILGGFAGVAGGGTLPSAAASSRRLSVMTRNLYVGVDLFPLLGATSADEASRIAGRLLDELESHPFTTRIEAIAAEIDATRPDVVGVQEAAAISTSGVNADGDESDGGDGGGGDGGPANGPDVSLDLLSLLSSKLESRGLAYEVAVETVTNAIDVPTDVDGRRVPVELTDRTAILVREGVETTATRSGTFDASLTISMDDVVVSLERGYCLVDVTIGSHDLTVATTHLESVDGTRRRAQAAELLDLLPTDRPVVLAGDVNSGPGTETTTYDLLTDSFADAHASVHGDADGHTCCHAADLRNDPDRLSRRIDVVLYRGGLLPTAVDRVGADPDDRVLADVEGESVHLWPSDHAGVVATFEIAASTTTGTADATPTATAADDDSVWMGLPTASIVGVGSVTAATLAAVALAWRRLLG